MNTNQLMTAAAIGFAGFAVWHITRKPGAVANQPGQQQRDAGLTTWADQQAAQWNDITAQETARLVRRYPAPT